MAYHVELQVAAKTDTGLVRSHIEDSIAHSIDSGLVALADGMGGYNAGEVASAIATSTLIDSLSGQLRSRDWSTHANRRASGRRIDVRLVTGQSFSPPLQR